ncbi:MAG TPA: thiol-disulfide oxidoreductase [Bacteroidales bacterium]|nr:thiol-disulfide oxidoreductase [Bacteroidales bacterium]
MTDTNWEYKINLQNPVVLFDGVCNLCNSSVQFIIRHDSENRFKFAALQSEIANQIFEQLMLEKPTVDSIILVENGNIYTQSDAVLRIGKLLNIYTYALKLYAALPAKFRNFLYALVAKNRYFFFGKQNQCTIPTPELKQRFEF